MTNRSSWSHRGHPAVAALAFAGVLLALANAPAACRGKGKSQESGRSWSVYRQAGERAVVAAADVEPIYEEALRFYRPPRNQCRWLDPRLLAAAPRETAARELDPELAGRLVERLGDRFCLLGEPLCGGRKQGGELQVSEIYAWSPDTARVVVACRMVWAGARVDNGAQAFLLVRAEKGWNIADRGGAGSAP